MNIQYHSKAQKMRATVWCLQRDLQAADTEGTFTFVDKKIEKTIGDGSLIIVMDAGLILHYSTETKVAYTFPVGSGGGGGGGSLVGSAIVGTSVVGGEI